MIQANTCIQRNTSIKMWQKYIVKIINKHQFDTSVKPHTLVPNYLKLTEAEEKRIKSDRTS